MSSVEAVERARAFLERDGRISLRAPLMGVMGEAEGGYAPIGAPKRAARIARGFES